MTAGVVVEDGEKFQTSDDARRREWIGLCAAKTAGMDGVSTQQYSRQVCRLLILQPRPQASGTARPIETGIRLEFLRQTGPYLLAPALCVAFALSATDLWPVAIFVSVLALLFGLPLGIMTAWNWREQLKMAGFTTLPAAQASIFVDEKSLTIGAISVSWADVRLERVELAYLWWPRINPKYRVDQLQLATNKGRMLLDRRLIKNGQEVVDTISSYLVEVN